MDDSSQTFRPYLSVVATSRNDDHGGDPLIRTQIFITNFVRQCERYKLFAELIIVDWNPVPDRPGLAAVLEVPGDTTYLQARVITVPTELHKRIKYSEKMPLFQMIAKNVGIRRARGEFIVATNIDILFSNELIQFVARKKLNPLKQYRVDRYDIHSGLSPVLSLDDTLEYAWANPIRTNRRYQPERLVKHLYGDELFRKVCVPEAEYCEWNEGVEIVSEEGVWQIRPERSVNMSHLHTNACGDFTLLSRKGWDAVRGYPEFEAFSFNIDSIGVIAAHYAGYTEVALLPPCVCFHIEHGIGSGWTPEGESKLFNRLRQAEILNPEWPVLIPLINEMRENGKTLEFNHAGWGMADFDLPEQVMGDTSQIATETINQLALQAEMHQVSAIQPTYDLDRLTLAHERRVLASIGRIEKVQMFIPDLNGLYQEENSISYVTLIKQTTKVVFSLEKFVHQYPLRFDPCESSGIIDISSIIAIDSENNKVVLEVNLHKKNGISVAGTAALFQSDLESKRMNTSAIKKNNVLWLGKPLALIKRLLLSQRYGVRAVKNFFPIGIKHRLKQFLFGREQSWKLSPIRIISNGSDPQIYLPPIPEDIGFPLLVTIEMQITSANL